MNSSTKGGLYLQYGRYRYEFRVRLTVIALWVWIGPCRRPKPWPPYHALTDAKPSNEYTLILRQVLVWTASRQRYLSVDMGKNAMCHHTSPLGPQCHAAPVLRPGENRQLILEWVAATSTPNDARASGWPPRKATLAQDLVRSVPVTRIISSILSTSTSLSRIHANHWSICLIMKLPFSVTTTIEARHSLFWNGN